MGSIKAYFVGEIIFLDITSKRNIKFETEKSCFFKDGWKLCRKMRLDALTVFIFLLNNDTKCLFRGVSDRNTKAKQ